MWKEAKKNTTAAQVIKQNKVNKIEHCFIHPEYKHPWERIQV